MKLTEKEWAKVDDIVDRCHCSIEEAIQVLQDDKAIDQGKRMYFDCSLEEEKALKKAYVNCTEKTLKKPRTRAENPTKRGFIAEIAEILAEKVDNLEVTNPERVISFAFGDEKYEIILQQKRKPKI